MYKPKLSDILATYRATLPVAEVSTSHAVVFWNFLHLFGYSWIMIMREFVCSVRTMRIAIFLSFRKKSPSSQQTRRTWTFIFRTSARHWRILCRSRSRRGCTIPSSATSWKDTRRDEVRAPKKLVHLLTFAWLQVIITQPSRTSSSKWHSNTPTHSSTSTTGSKARSGAWRRLMRLLIKRRLSMGARKTAKAR